MKSFRHPGTGETVTVQHEHTESIFIREGFVELEAEEQNNHQDDVKGDEDEPKKATKRKNADA